MKAKGFASLVSLLVVAMIMVFMAMAVYKIYTKSTPTDFTTLPNATDPQNYQNTIDTTQDAIDKYQQKSKENQQPDLEF